MKRILSILIMTVLLNSCSSMTPAPAEPEPVTPEPEVTSRVVTKDYSPYESITVSKGEFTDKIVISWEGSAESSWALYRSQKNGDPYVKIADITGETSYSDSGFDRGLKVWYRLENTVGDGVTITAGRGSEIGTVTDPETEDSVHENYGYMKSKKPKGKSLNQITKTFTKGKPKYTKEEQELVNSHLKLLEERIQHPVKLNMILMMAKPYFDSGKMAAYDGFTSFSYDMPEREVYLFDDSKSYVVVFKSYVISRFIRENNDGVFLERLLYNGVAFSVDMGEREVPDSEGYTRILPALDTVGFASAYYPKYAGWKNSTAMFATSRDSLKKELQKAQRNRPR